MQFFMQEPNQVATVQFESQISIRLAAWTHTHNLTIIEGQNGGHKYPGCKALLYGKDYSRWAFL